MSPFHSLSFLCQIFPLITSWYDMGRRKLDHCQKSRLTPRIGDLFHPQKNQGWKLFPQTPFCSLPMTQELTNGGPIQQKIFKETVFKSLWQSWPTCKTRLLTPQNFKIQPALSSSRGPPSNSFLPPSIFQTFDTLTSVIGHHFSERSNYSHSLPRPAAIHIDS